MKLEMITWGKMEYFKYYSVFDPMSQTSKEMYNCTLNCLSSRIVRSEIEFHKMALCQGENTRVDG